MYTIMENYRMDRDEKANALLTSDNKAKQLQKEKERLFSDDLEYADENALRADLQTPEGQKSVKSLLNDYRMRNSELRHKLDTTIAEFKDAQASRDRAIEQRRENEEVRNQQMEELNDKLNQLRNDLERQRTDLEQRINAANQRAADAEKRLAEAEEEWDEERKKMELQLTILQTKLEQLTGKRSPKEAIPPIIGKVVQTDLAEDYAVIDVGEKDDIRPKMIIEIYSQEDDTLKKARAVVTSVDRQISEVRFLESDLKMPIAMGDVVRAFITELGKQSFVVAGRFGRDLLYTKSEIEELITARGGTIMEDVDIDTDYLVIADVESDPADPYVQEGINQKNLAVKLGVPIMRIERLIEYIR